MIRKKIMAAVFAGVLTLTATTTALAAPAVPENGMQGGMSDTNAGLSDTAGTVVSGTTSNSASALTADTANAVSLVMSDENSSITISEAGTYIISGNCSDGNITVKKGTTGVVLILQDLDLTSSTGAAVSCNKNTEVQIVVSGTVSLTDAEDPADEDSSDTETADAFDGAAIKVKSGASVTITGSGTLNIDGSSCKNGIKSADDETTSLVIDGDLTMNITAANDAINAGYDLAILSGTLNITAGDDAIHADRVTTIGTETYGPVINIIRSNEGIEGTVVNIVNGDVTVNSTDDGINAANSDDTYADLGYSINILGGKVDVKSGGDGLDSNGNINLIGGSTSISSASAGGEAGIDYDGECYIAEGTVTNASGIAGPDMMPGQQGQMMPGQQGQQGQMMPGQQGQQGQQGQMMPGQQGQPGQMMPGQQGQQGQPGQMMPGQQGQQGQMMPGQQGQQSQMMPGQQGQQGQMMPGQQGQQSQMMPGQPGQPEQQMSQAPQDPPRVQEYDAPALPQDSGWVPEEPQAYENRQIFDVPAGSGKTIGSERPEEPERPPVMQEPGRFQDGPQNRGFR